MAGIVKENNIMERWFAGIPEAAGKGQKLERDFVSQVEAQTIPGISFEKKTIAISLGSGIKGIFTGNTNKMREFIMITNTRLPGFVIYVGTRDYGKQLLVSWYLVTDKFKIPAFARTFMDKDNFFQLDIYDTEELSAFVSLVHDALKGATKNLMGELNLDFTKVDTHTKGFLNIS